MTIDSVFNAQFCRNSEIAETEAHFLAEHGELNNQKPKKNKSISVVFFSVSQSQPNCDNHTNTILPFFSTQPPHLSPTFSPSLTPLHQIVFLPQINKHYQRVTDYGLVEAASVC